MTLIDPVRFGGSTASVALIWPFLTLGERSGLGDASARVRGELGLTREQFADPATRVPVSDLVGLLDQALHHSGERDVGLLAARYVERAHLGLMDDVTRTRATLRSALEAGMRYVPLLGDGVHYGFEVSGELATVRLWFDPGVELHASAVEFVVAVGLVWARRTTGIAELAPLEIHFTHEAPADTSRHQKLFRCKLHFSAPVTKVVMAARFLDRPLGARKPVLADLLEQRAEGLLRSLPRSQDVALRVRELLSTRSELRDVSARQVARSLGLGVRTLARRLQDEQTSYRAVLDDVRRQAALRLLTHSDRTIAEIADNLGFASPQGFQRAFRRWTGTSAAAYRRSQRSQAY